MKRTKKEMIETIADLEVDLAGCEATIEALEAELSAVGTFSVSIAALAGCEARIEELMAEVEKWKDKAEREGEARWRAEGDRDEYADRLAEALESYVRADEARRREALDQQRKGGIVRRAVRRALEVVR